MSSRIEVWTIPVLVALASACESGSSTASSGQVTPCTGSIGGLVWKDRDANGSRDPGEGGLAGVAMTLSQAGARVASTTTDGLGQYLFSPPLCAGDYTVAVAAPRKLAPTTPTSASVMLPDDDTQVDTVDFGFAGTAAIGDFVWVDLDCDGLQEPGEPGLDAVPVTLTDGSGATWHDTTVQGTYLFDRLCAGTYTVTVDESGLAAKYTQTLCDVGPDDTIDSECSPTTVALSEDDTVDTSIDFGYCPTGLGSIGDLVWHDLDGDGLQDPGEPGLVDVKLYLLDPVNTLEVLAIACSDENGHYRFDLLAPGKYLIEAVDTSLPFTSCFVKSPCEVGDDEEIDSNCGPACVSLSAGEVNDSIDFGYSQVGSGAIGDFVWNDLNGDGVQDPGEPGLEGVMVSLYGGATHPLCTERTDRDGAYLFESLCAGDYDVVAEVPPGFVASPCEVGSNPAVDSNCIPAHATLPLDDSEDRSIDFGFYVPVP